MKYLILTILIVVISGCAHMASRMNNISLGMNKKQVIEELGTPNSTKAGDGAEVLEYIMSPEGFTLQTYWVVLQQGAVTKYGKAGDFGTTAIPTGQLIIENKN